MSAWKSIHDIEVCDIEVWVLARDICKDLWQLVNRPEYRKDPGLRRQMLDSSGSMMDNIAEGFERGSNAEFKTFVGYGKGSSGELRSQLVRSQDRDFITEAQYAIIDRKVEIYGEMCGGLILSLKRRNSQRGFRLDDPMTPYPPEF